MISPSNEYTISEVLNLLLFRMKLYIEQGQSCQSAKCTIFTSLSPPLLKSIQIIFGFHIEIVRAATPGSRFDEEAMPLTRSWCLFELLQTVLLQVPWGAPVVRKILRKILLGNGEVCNKGTKLLASPCLRTDA